MPGEEKDGVYGLIPGRLFVGPASSALAFIQGDSFGGSPLPAPRLRVAISCLGGTAAAPPISPVPSSSSPQPAASSSSSSPSARSVEDSRRRTADLMARMMQHRRTTGTKSSADATAARQGQDDGAVSAAAAAAGVTLTQLAVDPASARLEDLEEGVTAIRGALARDPGAAVYVYSNTGHNRASALAALYMLRAEKAVPLAEVMARLPSCTPRVEYVLALQECATAENHDDSFRAAEFFPSYFARRYPRVEVRAIEAALQACGGNYKSADQTLRCQNVFKSSAEKTDSLLRSSRPYEESSGAPHTRSFASRTGSTHSGSGTAGLAAVAAAPAADDGISVSSSAPVTLNRIDDEVIATLHKGLTAAGVLVSLQDLTESYVANRRHKDLVLRDIIRRQKGDTEKFTDLSVRNVERLARMGVESPMLREASPLPNAPDADARRDSVGVGSIHSDEAELERSAQSQYTENRV